MRCATTPPLIQCRSRRSIWRRSGRTQRRRYRLIRWSPLHWPRIRALPRGTPPSMMIDVERLEGRPDFTLMARYGYRPRVIGYNFPDFFSAFVGIRLPLWASRKQHRMADAARADYAAAGAERRGTELQLSRDVTETAARVAAAEQSTVPMVD